VLIDADSEIGCGAGGRFLLAILASRRHPICLPLTKRRSVLAAISREFAVVEDWVLEVLVAKAQA